MCRTSLPVALASARTRSVGVLVPTIANSIFADTVQGLSDELEPLGYAVILAQSRYDAAREDHMLSALLSRRPEAIIMVGSPATEDGARLLRRAGIPSRRPGSFRRRRSTLSPASTITKPALRWRGIWSAQGRKSLAFIGGDDPRATRRWNGFNDTAQALGAKAPRRLVLDRNASGSVVALADLPGVDAVFAANDAHAIGFMSGLRTAGPVAQRPGRGAAGRASSASAISKWAG